MGFSVASVSGKYNQTRLIGNHLLEVNEGSRFDFQRIFRATVLLVYLVMRGIEREIAMQSIDMIISQIRQPVTPVAFRGDWLAPLLTPRCQERRSDYKSFLFSRFILWQFRKFCSSSSR